MGLNVLHINSHTTWRGGEQQVDSIFNGFYKNIQTFLFCPENSVLAERNEQFKERVFTYKKHFGLDVPAAFRLKKISKEKSIDLIHLHDSHAINTYLAAVFFGLKTPCVIHRRVSYPVTSVWKYNHKNILKIICISQEVKKKMLKVVPENKLTVIYSGIDLKKYRKIKSDDSNSTNGLRKELAITPEKKVVGIVTSIEQEKNVEEFAEIGRQLAQHRKEVECVVIGGGSQLKTISQQYPFIHFTGFKNTVPELLQDMDIFLFTSHSEGLGTAVLEAMAAEVTVVCRNFPVALEIIQDNNSGYIYSTVEDAVQKVNILLDDSEKRLEFSAAALQMVQQFDVTLMNQQIENLYSSFHLKQ
ncbi:MAG: glycosyltransferase family 4 protein [Sphingobacteriales bacterium]|nr:glycosyltransferase family 4 protein [Sphingobacteriales bacterium]